MSDGSEQFASCPGCDEHLTGDAFQISLSMYKLNAGFC